MTKQEQIQSKYTDYTHVSRWVVINNQITCRVDVIDLVVGWWRTYEDAQVAYLEQKGLSGLFDDYLFRVKELEFTGEYWDNCKDKKPRKRIQSDQWQTH